MNIRPLLAFLLASALLCTSQTIAAPTAPAADEKDPFTELRTSLQELPPAEALQKYTAALDNDPDNLRLYDLSSVVASRLYREGLITDAVDLLDSICERLQSRTDGPGEATLLGRNVSALLAYGRRLEQEGTAERVATRIDSAVEIVGKLAAEEPSLYTSILAGLISSKATSLQDRDNSDAAGALLAEYTDSFRAQLGDHTEAAVRGVSMLMQMQISTAADAAADSMREQLEADFGKARELMPDSAVIMSEFLRFRFSQASLLSRERPDSAARMISDLKEIVDASTVAEHPLVASSMRSLAALEQRIAAARLLLEMVGKPAPEFDYGTTAHGETITAESLRGKVILVDFWAVWCGPCIATFPHLNSLHDEFHDAGLEIVGVTRQYNYEWNDEQGRASRSMEEVPLEAELAMLEKFMDSHELRHSTVVVPGESRMHSNFGVTGIPHAVVIDRAGIVRLIKVGSGEANAAAIHDEIARLVKQ